MNQVSVLGLGNWGTAIAHHLARHGNTVIGWDRDKDVVAGIQKSRRNPACLSEVELSNNIRPTSDLNQALTSKFIVLAFASAALKDMIPQIKVDDKAIIISAIKGLEGDSLLTPLQFAETILPPQKTKLVTLSGPSFAKDVIAEKPCGVVAASKDEEAAIKVAELFSVGLFRVYTSTDPLGVELGGVLKNVIALAAGVSDGLELGDSARTALITRGLAEITRLAVAMGANSKTLTGLSGMGDLVMTASSDLSRNRMVGVRLGRGEKLSTILSTIGSTAEGVRTAPLVVNLSQKYKVDMPIAQGVFELVEGRATPKEILTSLVARPLRKE